MLPTEVLQRVLRFAAADFVVDVMPRTPQLPEALLAVLAQVSPRWQRAVLDQRREFAKWALRYDFQEEEEDLLTAVATRRGHLRSLQLTLRLARAGVQMARDQVAAWDARGMHWDAVFAQCPQLERLDVSGVPLHSHHLPQILDAASRNCRGLVALVLPAPEWYCPAAWMDWRPVMDALYAALERWYCNGTKGGLRQLTVPRRTGSRDHFMVLRRCTEQYLRAIAKFCPQIQYLDGWQTTYAEQPEGILCQELMLCSLKTWCEACRSSAHMREVNWFVLPFVDAFFDAFQAVEHSELKRLTFAGGERTCFDGDTIYSTYCSDGSQWHFSKNKLAQCVRSCPALEELRMVFQNDAITEQFRVGDIDDSMLCAVAKACPKLRKFEMRELNVNDQATATNTISGAGVTALARLARLNDIRLKATRCDGKAVFELVQGAPLIGSPRVVELAMGSTEAGQGPSAREVVNQALHQMQLALQLVATRKFHIHITGSSSATASCCKWKAVADEMHHVCPQLFVSIIERNGELDTTISTVKALQPRISQCLGTQWLDHIVMHPVVELATSTIRCLDTIWHSLTRQELAWWHAAAL